jgi:hypothetical protein
MDYKQKLKNIYIPLINFFKTKHNLKNEQQIPNEENIKYRKVYCPAELVTACHNKMLQLSIESKLT